MKNYVEPRIPEGVFNTLLILLILGVVGFMAVSVWAGIVTHGGRI